MTNRLTQQTAATAMPRDKRYSIWDNQLHGFGLRVCPTGARGWLVKYRADGGGRNGRQRWLSLGSFPKISATEARQKAKSILAAVALGDDPASDLATRRGEMTVSELIKLYAAEGLYVQRGIRQGEAMKPKTSAYTLARLRNHVAPLIGSKRLTGLTEADVEKLARDVTSGRTASDTKLGPRQRSIVRGGAGAARKVVRDLSALLSFAQRRRLIEHNPVKTASVRKTDNSRDRYLSNQEIARVGSALQTLEREGYNPKAIAIIRLWILTGARRNEIAGLRWGEVDLDQGLLVLADSKSGRSTRPLGLPALTLLRSLQPEVLDPTGFVFPAERGTNFYVGTQRVWPVLRKVADIKGVTPHTLRHTVGSVAASSGEALLVIGAILGHTNARSTQAYAHIDRDPARMAADRATGLVADALGAAEI